MNVVRWLSYIWRLIATALCFTVFGIGGVLAPLVATPVLRLLPGDARTRQCRARLLIHWLFRGFVHLMRALGVMSWHTEGLDKLRGEALLCWLLLQRDDGLLPPHHWDGVVDPELPELAGLARTRLDRPPRTVMSNSFAFGGNNLSLILTRDRP